MIWLVTFLSMINGWRAFGLSRQRDLLQELGTAIQPTWLFIAALVWAILFAGAALSLWQRRPFMRRATPILILGYALYQLALTTFWVRSNVAQQGWPAAILLYTLALLFTTWALNRPAARPYFETTSGDQPDPHS
jgi:hypothetical protein